MSLKRLLDICVAAIGLLVASPVILVFMFLVTKQDGHSPFYIAPRVGKGGRMFNMVKLRSMVVNADSTAVDSTSANDTRITTVGRLIRKYKLDEITQLWNVLKGDMSLVGPRPNVPRGVDVYTEEERRLLSVAPGVTDFSSIIFSDEGEILADKDDPDRAYDQLIRPWKSKLGLFYIDNQNILLDIKIIWWTIIAIISKKTALSNVVKELIKLNAPSDIVQVSRREKDLTPSQPPGLDKTENFS